MALPTKGLQARNALDQYLSRSMVKLNIRIELNEVKHTARTDKKSNLITILAEATIYNATGVKAIPIEMPSNEMDGCVHMLKNAYRKRSSLAFIKLLKDSIAVRERVLDF